MVPAVKKYAEKLISEGVITAEEFQEEQTRYDQNLEEGFEAGKTIDRYIFNDRLVNNNNNNNDDDDDIR